ncbi:hypothetical protein BJX61DRAFT_531929 [Aspergillus egyptiacus]|nr:hypothetical protein BJX61DRAFT_531929 [Aspergillus egyptiacus]
MATPSAIPKPTIPRDEASIHQAAAPADDGSTKLLPPAPKFRLHIEDLRHPASRFFLSLIPDLASTLETALSNIIQYLYTPPTAPSTAAAGRKPASTFEACVPPTRSVTVLLRDIGGVAYTTGKELDNDHKEIHVSLPYVQHCRSKSDPLAELVGVITHELVHCYQYAAPRASLDGKPDGSLPVAPGGLIEGVADFVRLKAGLDPPHWNRPSSAKERPEKWDTGYQHTAYFLAWLEDVHIGKGAVGLLNDRLRRVGYIGEGKSNDRKNHEGESREGFWQALFGSEVDELWEEYGRWLDKTGSTQGSPT